MPVIPGMVCFKLEDPDTQPEAPITMASSPTVGLVTSYNSLRQYAVG